jgi:chromosome segregation ATPase
LPTTPAPLDYSTLSSPGSVHSPVGNPNSNLDIPVLERVLEEMAQENQVAEAQEEQLNILQQREFILEKQLGFKDKEIEQLEETKQHLTQQIKELEAQVSQSQAELKKQVDETKSLKIELEQTETDLYQVGGQKDQVQELYKQAKTTIKQLEEQLAQEVNENECLTKKQDETSQKLLNKLHELSTVKKLAQDEKEGLQELIKKQEEQYQQERLEREADHQKKMENLMKFQINNKSLTYLKDRPAHTRSYSFSSLNSSFGQEEDNQEAAGPSLSSPPLSSELDRAKKKPNSLLFGSKSPVEESENQLEQSLQAVLNLVGEKTIQEEQVKTMENNLAEYEALIAENEQLKKSKVDLERIYKDLFDEQPAKERQLKVLNEELLALKEQQQKLQEKNDELKYQLAEAKTGQGRAEKKLKDQVEESADLTSLNQKIAELTTERDALQKKLATAQQQLDNKRSDRS